MKENSLRKIWDSGRCAVNGWLSLPSPLAAEAMAKQGWDSLTIDMQHGFVDYAAITTMLPAAAAAGIDALVRVPWLDEADIMKALDAGAAGVICPMINSRAAAERFAAAVRYPPQGARSFGPLRAALHYGDDYPRRANQSVIALAMIETAEAVENVADILSVAGIDGVYIGPADLACSLGCEVSFTPTTGAVAAAIEVIYAAAAKAGRRAGIHTGSPAFAATMRDKGFDLVTIQSDLRFMMAGARAAVSAFKETEGKNENTTNDDGAGAGQVSGGAAY